MKIFPSFEYARRKIADEFLDCSYEVKAPRWQGVDISTKPEMAMREILNYSFQISLRGIENPKHWAQDTGCNEEFANLHFSERVGGEPLNPGEAWKIWPWGHNAEKFLDQNGEFDHTYQERFWPKYAGYGAGGKLDNLATEENSDDGLETLCFPRRGIRFDYADLKDLVSHLVIDPLSRQAYLPIWFPEDGTCKGRRPCSLGYWFVMRHGYLHIVYYIRSCDLIRHFADDCYLTVRLLLWVLERLREHDVNWGGIKAGLFTMHIGSLHCFINDWIALRAGKKTIPV